MEKKDYVELMQKCNCEDLGVEYTEANIREVGLDEGSMFLIHEDETYIIVNYNERGTELQFLNIINKETEKRVELIEL